MGGLRYFTRDNALRLLRGVLYLALAGAALESAGLPRLGDAVMLLAAVAFVALVAVLVEHSRRCLD